MHNFIFILLLLICCSSCTKEVIYDVSGKPILFSQEMEVETRAETSNSVSSMNGKVFGVRGYKYGALWESEEKQGKPDAKWHNVPVDCDANGMCNYVNVMGNKMELQFWEKKMRYAFFGYYPFSDGPTAPVQLSDVNKLGSPVLTYTLSDKAVGAKSKWVGSPTAMHDVMYGKVIDANGEQNSSVPLSFKHALFGVQVVAENFHDSTPVTIKKLSVKLNLKYRKMEIPMNGDPVKRYFFDGSPDNGAYKTQTVTFHYITAKDKPVTINSTLNLPTVDLSNGKHLLLIPQEKLMGEARITLEGEAKEKVVDLKFPNGVFEAGTRYMLDIQFVGDNVNVIVIQGSEWFDNESKIEFE